MSLTTTVFPAFRDFTKLDYQLYAGVESPSPRIVDIEELGTECGLSIILDGSIIHLSLFADDEANEWFSCDYPGNATAEAVAEAMLTLAKATLEASENNTVCDVAQAIVEKYSLTLV
jgi:hypothetical protein